LRPAVCHELALSRDRVLVAKAGSTNVTAARVDHKPVVKVNGPEVTDVRLDRQRLVALLLDVLVPLRVAGEVVDASDLEPHEVGGVVRNALRVRFREPHGDVGVELEALHRCVLSRQ
jgi:hypothetical protein